MIRPTLISAVALLLLMGAAPAPAVRYVVSPVMGTAGLESVAVTVTFTGEADGETRLILPDDWGGHPELWKHLEGLTVSGGTVADAGPAARTIRHKPGALLTVRYRLKSGYPGDPGPGNPYRPIIRPGWFQLIGEAAFVEPDGSVDKTAAVTFRGWPKDWTLASDLDHERKGRPLSVGHALESITVGGADLRVERRQLPGGVLRVAVRGQWEFTDAAFADQVAGIISAQRRFWGDMNEPYFVSLIPLAAEEGWRSIGGTGRGDAFALFSTTNASQADLRGLLAHEHAHSWIPGRLGVMGSPEPADYWFSEGFTEFYATRTLLRAGLMTLEEYSAWLNEVLAAHDASPARGLPNSAIIDGFWKDPAVQKLPYRRGVLMALLWDDRIRQATGGRRDLDDVVLGMRDRNIATTRGIPVRDNLTAAMIALGVDPAADIARHVEAGEEVALPRALFGDCGAVTEETRGRFERGWEAEQRGEDWVLVKVRPGSRAHEAGLRDGMVLIARVAGTPGDERLAYGVKVREGSGERTYSYMPVGEGSYRLRTFTLTTGLDAAGRETCRRRISGEI